MRLFFFITNEDKTIEIIALNKTFAREELFKKYGKTENDIKLTKEQIKLV